MIRCMGHHVVALALPGVVAFDLSTVAQVFGYVGEEEYTFEVASAQGGDVMTSTGFTIGGTSPLAALTRADTVLVPGYRPHSHPGEEVVDALRTISRGGVRIASVTGAFALAAAGLLEGLRCTTHWQDAQELRALYPGLEVDAGVLYVDHGVVATSAGVAAGIDLCLHLVRSDHGHDVAARIARRMVVAPHRAGGQAQFVEEPSVAALRGNGVGEAMSWAVGHLQDDVALADLARVAHVSQRHFARLFVAQVGVTPLRWVTHQRVLEARRLLEVSDLPVEVVAQRCGLGTAATLRRVLRREVGVSPSAYREMFARPGSPGVDLGHGR